MSSPQRPRGMSPAMKRVWDQVVSEIDADLVSVELLRTWCWTVTRLRHLEGHMNRHGTTIEHVTAHGSVRVVEAPWFTQARGLRSDLVKLSDALALSPRARGIAEEATDDDSSADPLAKLRERREARLREAGAAS